MPNCTPIIYNILGYISNRFHAWLLLVYTASYFTAYTWYNARREGIVDVERAKVGTVYSNSWCLNVKV